MKQLSCLIIMVLTATISLAQQFEWHQVQRPGNTVDYIHTALHFEINSAEAVLCDNNMWKSGDHGKTWQYLEQNRYGRTIINKGMEFGVPFLNGNTFAADSAGLLKFDRSSMSWQRTYKDAIEPFDYWYYYADFASASNGELFALLSRRKVVHSTDDGASWDSVGIPPRFDGAMSITSIDHFGRIYLLYGNNSGATYELFISDDKGKSWELIYEGTRGKIHSIVHLHSGETYTITKDQQWWLLKSDNTGRNWRTQTNLAQYMPADLNYSPYPAIIATLKGTLLLSLPGTILRSLDSGLTWHPMPVPSATVGLYGFPIVDSSNNIYTMGISNGLNRFTDRGIYISADEGNTWSRSAIPHYSIQNIFTDRKRDRILAEVGMPYMYDWTVGYGITGTFLYDSLRNDVPLYSNIIGSIYDTLTNKIAYQTSLDRIVSFATLQRIDNRQLYRSEALISDDGGQTWGYRMLPPTGTGASCLFISRNGSIYVGTGEYIYRSVDNGYSWDQLINGITNPNIYSIAESPRGFMFVGSQSSIYRTIETYFTKLKPNLLNTNVTCFAFDSAKGIYAGTNRQGVVYSNDNGESWTPLRNGLPFDTAISQLMVTPKGIVFAATLNGLFALEVGDTVWHEESTGLNDRALQSLGMLDDDTYLVGTLHSGMYINKPFPAPILLLGVKLPPSVRIEGSLKLGVNYPNPFSTETKIRYEVPEAGKVILEAYSLLGERVAILENGYHAPGVYESSFSANTLPAGTYIYRLKIGDHEETRRMIKH
jgi:photosystem II stability/assembly factor-like uncharacterized protein